MKNKMLLWTVIPFVFLVMTCVVIDGCTKVQDGNGPIQPTKTEKEQRVEKYNEMFVKALTICNGNDGFDDIWQSGGYLNVECKNGVKIQFSLSY